MNEKKIKLNKSIVFLMVFAVVVLMAMVFWPSEAKAAPCASPPAGGNYSVSTNCAFSGNVNGVDGGNLTVNSGRTLTINANQTIVFNSGYSVTVNGSIAVSNAGSQLKKTKLWMEDKDGDGWPATLTQRFSDGQPSNHARRSSMRSITTTDCNDNAPSATNDCTPPPVCGDGICNGTETAASCNQDCGYCGDGICGAGESSANCPTDCGAAPFCGDGICNGGETAASCNQDCGYCGDGICGAGESSANCPGDCGAATCTPSSTVSSGWTTCDSSCSQTRTWDNVGSDCSTWTSVESRSCTGGSCVSGPTCNIGSWVDVGCGQWGCASTQMTQGNSWQWSDGSGECNYTGRCVASSSCGGGGVNCSIVCQDGAAGVGDTCCTDNGCSSCGGTVPACVC